MKEHKTGLGSGEWDKQSEKEKDSQITRGPVYKLAKSTMDRGPRWGSRAGSRAICESAPFFGMMWRAGSHGCCTWWPDLPTVLSLTDSLLARQAGDTIWSPSIARRLQMSVSAVRARVGRSESRLQARKFRAFRPTLRLVPSSLGGVLTHPEEVAQGLLPNMVSCLELMTEADEKSLHKLARSRCRAILTITVVFSLVGRLASWHSCHRLQLVSSTHFQTVDTRLKIGHRKTRQVALTAAIEHSLK